VFIVWIVFFLCVDVCVCVRCVCCVCVWRMYVCVCLCEMCVCVCVVWFPSCGDGGGVVAGVFCECVVFLCLEVECVLCTLALLL